MTNSDIINKWIDSGKDRFYRKAYNNVGYYKNSLYSYASILAVYKNGMYFINHDIATYSNTSKRHASLLRQALSSSTYFEYSFDEGTIEYYVRTITELVWKQSRARTRDYKDRINSLIYELKQYIQHFQDIPTELTGIVFYLIGVDIYSMDVNTILLNLKFYQPKE
jgi:hypothetical protein